MRTRLHIEEKEHFRKALRFAKSLNKEARNSFLRCLTTLNRLKRNAPEGFTLYIYTDFVDHSFSWHISNEENKCWFNGGMILHGYQETFSVELTPQNGPHWSIHT